MTPDRSGGSSGVGRGSSTSGAPVTLVWGDSPFLVREAALELFDAPPTEVDASEWRPQILADLATPSLFGEARGLLVSDANALPDEARSEIAGYAAQPAPEARLVLAAFLDPRAKAPSRSLRSAVGDSARVLRAAVERRELPGWVRERARRHGAEATPAGAQALIETVGEDPAILDQAVAQLASAGGLSPETVARQFRGLGERRVWELCDAAFSGNLPRAVRSLVGMLESREEALPILGGIASRLRDLMRVRSLPPRTPPREVAERAGLRFDWQARRYREQANRYTPEQLSAIHTDLVEADGLIKQGGAGGVVLARLVARIARPSEEPSGAHSGAR